MSRLDERFDALQAALAMRSDEERSQSGASEAGNGDSNLARSRNAAKIGAILLSWSAKEVRDFIAANADELSEGELSAVSLALSKLQENEAEMATYIEGRKKYSRFSKLLSKKLREYDLDDELLAAVRSEDKDLIGFVFDSKFEPGAMSDINRVFFESDACYEDVAWLEALFWAMNERGFNFSMLPDGHEASKKFLDFAAHRQGLLPVLDAFWLKSDSRDSNGRNLIQIASIARESLEFKLSLLAKMGEDSAFSNVEGAPDVWMTFIASRDLELWKRFVDSAKDLSPARTLNYLNALNPLHERWFMSHFLSTVPLPVWTKAVYSHFPWYQFESSTVHPSLLAGPGRDYLEERRMSPSSMEDRISVERLLMEKCGIDLWTAPFKGTVFNPLEFGHDLQITKFRAERAVGFAKYSPSRSVEPLDNAMLLLEGLKVPANLTMEEKRRFSNDPAMELYRLIVLEFLRFWELEFSKCKDPDKKAKLVEKMTKILLSIPTAIAFRPNALDEMKSISKTFGLSAENFPPDLKASAFEALLADSGGKFWNVSEIMNFLGVNAEDRDCHAVLERYHSNLNLVKPSDEAGLKSFFIDWIPFFIDVLSRWHQSVEPHLRLIRNASREEVTKILVSILRSDIKPIQEQLAEKVIDAFAHKSDWSHRIEKFTYAKLVSKIHPNPFLHVERRFHGLIRPGDRHRGDVKFSVNVPDSFLFQTADELSINLRFIDYNLSVSKDPMPLAMALFVDSYAYVGHFNWSEPNSAYSISVNKGTYDAPRPESIRMLWEVLRRTKDAFEHNNCGFCLSDLWNSGFIVRARDPNELWKMFDENPTVSPEIQHRCRDLMESYFRRTSAPVAPPTLQPSNNVGPKPPSTVFSWIKKILK